MSDWHDDDYFWNLMAPFFFDEARWEGTAVEVDLVCDLAQMGAESAVLDLGCGPGRHALELARRGHNVTGVDRTKAYLRQARYRAVGEGLDVEFLEADMREFRRTDSFDVALSLFTTFGYFAEAAQNALVLRNVHESLREGGVLLMDLMGKEVLARIFQARNWNEKDGVYWLEERDVTNNWSWMDLRWFLFSGDQRTEYRLGQWLYSAVELETVLHQAGFGRVDVYGDLQGRPYDLNAQRLVAAAWK
mgnify:CR=1 FL=1